MTTLSEEELAECAAELQSLRLSGHKNALMPSWVERWADRLLSALNIQQGEDRG